MPHHYSSSLTQRYISEFIVRGEAILVIGEPSGTSLGKLLRRASTLRKV
jgi:hypothetical protein